MSTPLEFISCLNFFFSELAALWMRPTVGEIYLQQQPITTTAWDKADNVDIRYYLT